MTQAGERLETQELDAISHEVVGAAIEVHRALGPGRFNVQLLRDGISRLVLGLKGQE